MDMDVAAEIQALKEENQELRDLIGALTVQVGCGISINAEIHDGEKVGRLSDFLKCITFPDGSMKLAFKVYADGFGPSRYEGDDLTEEGTYVVDEVGKFGPLVVYVVPMSTNVNAGIAGWPW